MNYTKDDGNTSRLTDIKLPFKSVLDETALASMARGMQGVMDGLLPGWDMDQSTQDTPRRFAKYLAEFRQPLDIDKIFGSTFDDPADHPPMIIQAPIPFRMVCEHHLLPAIGTAALGYIPHKRVLGLSKLSRLVDAVGTERPSLQEHVANRIVALMNEHLEPKGVMLVIKSQHGCMACRGVNVQGVDTISSHVTGAFRDNVSARAEFLSLINGVL